MTRTIVVGAGVAGLATAVLLAREGHDVTVFERGAGPGGRAGSLARDGFRFDLGPSWYLMPQVFEHFFELLGTTADEQLDLRVLDPSYRVFLEPEQPGTPGSSVTVPAELTHIRELFERLEPGSGPAFDAYVQSAQVTADMAEQYFLYNPFSRVRSLWQPAVLRALPQLVRFMGTSLESHVTARFRHPVLRKILGYPSVFLGTHPAAAPALFHLMSAFDLGAGVRYPMGGFWSLVQRIETLARDAGVRFVYGAEVTSIACEAAPRHRSDGVAAGTARGHVARVTGVRWRDATGADHTEHADIVVSAADLHHTETQLLPSNYRSYPERWWRRRISGPGAVLVLLGVRGDLPELPHHSLLFATDWRKNFADIFGPHPQVPDPASSYVCKPSATDPTVAPANHENLFLLVPVPADPSMGGGGTDGGGSPEVERAADQAIDQLAQWASIPDLRARIVVRETIGPDDFANRYHSWRGGMLGPAHVLRQSAMFRPQNASRKVTGLFYAGATTAPGIGVPMCLISAELVLKRIRGDASPGPLATRSPATPAEWGRKRGS